MNNKGIFMFYKKIYTVCAVLGLLSFTGCVNDPNNISIVDNSPTKKSIYQNTQSVSEVAGVGMESQDIETMTDKMIRDILSSPQILSKQVAPRIIFDSSDFRNQSSERIDKDMIIDSIYTGLLRSAMGRIVFLKRDYINAVQNERALKRNGKVGEGALGSTKNIMGADYKIVGRITTRDAINANTGLKSRYTVIFFSIIDLETGAAVWANDYKYKKVVSEDIIYR
jgi:PBP1b-binding outer membrane lipoprotein LpoB